ncbi:MAG: hypothetical protein AAGJ80_16115 [Cyanobacteria bacterium J06553_1]
MTLTYALDHRIVFTRQEKIGDRGFHPTSATTGMTGTHWASENINKRLK